MLADYGPETKATREQLRRTVAASIETIWPEEKTGALGMTDYERTNGMEVVQMTLFKVTPTTDAQHQLLATAQQIISELREARWLLIEQAHNIIPKPFLVMLLFWLTMLHLSFGLLAPRNGTTITVLLISALSVSGAIFTVLEMTHPLQGMIKVSSAPMRKALEHLGQQDQRRPRRRAGRGGMELRVPQSALATRFKRRSLFSWLCRCWSQQIAQESSDFGAEYSETNRAINTAT